MGSGRSTALSPPPRPLGALEGWAALECLGQGSVWSQARSQGMWHPGGVGSGGAKGSTWHLSSHTQTHTHTHSDTESHTDTHRHRHTCRNSQTRDAHTETQADTHRNTSTQTHTPPRGGPPPAAGAVRIVSGAHGQDLSWSPPPAHTRRPAVLGTGRRWIECPGCEHQARKGCK